LFNLAEYLGNQSRLFAVFFAIALVAIIGFVDFITGYQASFSVFYLLPIGLASWFLGRYFAIFISLCSVAVSIGGDLAKGMQFSSPLVPAWNALIMITLYLIVVWLVTIVRAYQRNLEARVQQSTAELIREITERERLEQELLNISEQTQIRLGHDLHDSLGQHLTAIAFASQVLVEQLEKKSLAESTGAKQLVQLVEDGITLTRTLARSLCPIETTNEGLMDGLHTLARSISKQFTINCECECPQAVILHNENSSMHLYHIAQEAVTNAIKHGKAKHIQITLTQTDKLICLTIVDDGIGLPGGARKRQGLGLEIMAYRARKIGALFDIERLPNSGTRVSCTLPINSTRTTITLEPQH
jgi:signal transduction histidine kinase